MKSNKHKTNAIKIGLAAVFTLLIGGFIYVTRYRSTDIDAAVSPDGAHEIIFQAVGEPDRPFGYSQRGGCYST